MKSSNLLFLASWVILLVVFAAIILLSAQSLRVAYTGSDGLTKEYTLTQIGEQGGDEAVKAFRGRRVTAATWALGYGLLAIAVIWVPYRRGERWAWWALFISVGLSQLLSLARAIPLGSTGGTGAAGIILALVLLGLMAGTPRMFSQRSLARDP
jgi:hypothetical protein